MMVAEAVVAPKRAPRPRLYVVPKGTIPPRVAPPPPKSSDIAELRHAAEITGKPLYPWQDLAGQYMTALTPAGRWKFPEFCLVVARQNGKTNLLIVRIVMGLLRGERIMMTAQDRQLIVRDVFNEVADIIEVSFPDRIKGKPRRANGQESITMRDGGRFRIVAPTRGGARGPSNDLVIVDEAREMTDHEFIAGANPTLAVSKAPRMGQIIYTSNAGDRTSVVLNALRKRAEKDRSFGYVEWSADPDRALDDHAGWREANPSLVGGLYAKEHMAFLKDMHEKYTSEGEVGIFQTEHLCQWVTTLRAPVVTDEAWEQCRGAIPEVVPPRSIMGIKVDPDSRRASAAVAWRDGDEVCVRSFAEDSTAPLDLDAFAAELVSHAKKARVSEVVYDGLTDRDLARLLERDFRLKPCNGRDYEHASETFKRRVEGGKLRHDDDGFITEDLTYTVRRNSQSGGGWYAMRATPERPTTAAEAAIRAVWLASDKPRVIGKVH